MPEGSIVYYNAVLANGKTIIEADGPFCNFYEQRSQPLVQDASQYDFTVIRLVGNGLGRSLPLFIPQIELGQSDPNKTVYEIVLTYQFYGYNPSTSLITSPVFRNAQSIIYSPENTTIAPPATPITRQDSSNEYYYVKTYASFIESCNGAFARAFDGSIVMPDGSVQRDPTSIASQLTAWWIGQGYSAGSVPDISGSAPILSFDGVSGLFQIEATTSYQTGGPAAAPAFHLLFNAPLQNLFANFPFLQEVDYFRLHFSPFVQTASNGKVLLVQEAVSTDQCWSPIGEFVLQSTLLPCVPEATMPPNVLGLDDGVHSSFSPQITDISVFLEDAHDQTSMIYYAPTPQYRLISLGRQRVPIQNVDIQILWRHRITQELIPIKLGPGSSVSIKMAFIKKDV